MVNNWCKSKVLILVLLDPVYIYIIKPNFVIFIYLLSKCILTQLKIEVGHGRFFSLINSKFVSI